jgi:hypothetical protein
MWGALNTLCYLGDKCTRVVDLEFKKKIEAWEKKFIRNLVFSSSFHCVPKVSTYLNFKYIIVMNGTTKVISQMCHEQKSYEKPQRKTLFH